jgi:hypothetical protein
MRTYVCDSWARVWMECDISSCSKLTSERYKEKYDGNEIVMVTMSPQHLGKLCSYIDL